MGRHFAVLVAVSLFAAIAMPVQGAAANPKLEPRPASSSALSALPNPSPRPKMPSRAPTGSTSVSPHALTAGGAWSWQNPSPDGNPLNAVSCPSTTTCFAASSDGRVLITTTGNAPWNPQTTGITVPINAISCATTTTCVAVADLGDVVRTSDGGANWANVVINGGSYLGGVSCPSTLICFAVGGNGAILKSGDGGGTWAAQTSGTNNNLFAISCPTTTMCVAVAAGGVTTRTTDGSSWTVQVTGTTNSLYGVSCPTTTICDAAGAGGVVMITQTGGSTWTGSDVGSNSTVTMTGVSCPSSTACYMAGLDGSVYFRNATFIKSAPAHGSTGESGSLGGISCPSVTSCFAVGDFGTIVSTTTAGTAWTQQSATPGSLLYGISCPTTTVCFAVGVGGAISNTTNGGATWSAQTPVNSQTLLSVSCLDITHCFAVGFGGTVIATTNGTSWTAQLSGTSQNLPSISCVNTTTCFAVTDGANFIKTTDGAHWSTPAPVGAALGLTAISCPTATICFATGTQGGTTNHIYSTADGGNTWALSFNLDNDPQAGINAGFQAITCPNTTYCYAVGVFGLIAATSDGGANWRTDNPVSSATLTGVSCTVAGFCHVSALDSTILYTTDFGGTWEVQMGFQGYSGISCPSTNTCFAADVSGNVAATTGAAAWAIARPSGITTPIRATTCASNSDCYAVTSNTLLASHNGGAGWAATTLRTTDQLTAISCPYTTICFAVGWPGAIYRTGDGGTTWTRQANSLYGSDNTFLGVSCPLNWQCTVVGTQGIVLNTTNDGNTWAAETSGTTQFLTAVSCPDASTCVAVGDQGLTLTWSGGSWQAHPTSTTKNLRSVSCPSTTICYAVGIGGTLLVTQNRGASWTAQASGTVRDLYGVSCVRTFACLFVGNFGTVDLTVDGSTWSAVNMPTANDLRSVVFQDLNHAWVAGVGGTILANQTLSLGCSSVSVSGNPPMGTIAGAQVPFTATSTGCPNPLYEFWLRPQMSNTWQLVQAFSASATWTWNSTGAQFGTVFIGVWARDATSSNAYDSLASFGYFVYPPAACSSVTESASPPSPSPAGTQVTFTATASGCGPLYEFWARWQGYDSWQLLQGYSTSNVYHWNSTGAAAGIEYIGVWAKDAGSPTGTFDANASIQYSVTTSSCGTVMTASAAPTTVVHGSGTHVTITGSIPSCPDANPLFEFWMRTTTTDWQLVQAYSTSATYDWNSSGAPVTTVYFGVWVKDAKSSTSTFDANVSVAIPVT